MKIDTEKRPKKKKKKPYFGPRVRNVKMRMRELGEQGPEHFSPKESTEGVVTPKERSKFFKFEFF